MDAYNIQKEIFKLWQQLVNKSDAASISKTWAEVPVYVNGHPVINVKIENNKIILETK
jgi:hypothetical protein